MHRLLRQVIDTPRDAAQVAASLRAGLEVVVITKEQSLALPDEGTSHARYAVAGLHLDEFRSLDEWERLDDGQVGRPDALAEVEAGDAVWDMMGREWAVSHLDQGHFIAGCATAPSVPTCGPIDDEEGVP